MQVTVRAEKMTVKNKGHYYWDSETETYINPQTKKSLVFGDYPNITHADDMPYSPFKKS